MEAEKAPICGAKGDNIRAMCSLSKGHVQSIDDWHEAVADTVEHIKTNTFETTVTRHEDLRWRPNAFEIDNPKERDKEVKGLLGPSIQDKLTKRLEEKE